LKLWDIPAIFCSIINIYFKLVVSKVISKDAIKRRKYWVGEIQNLSGNFGTDTERLEKELGE